MKLAVDLQTLISERFHNTTRKLYQALFKTRRRLLIASLFILAIAGSIYYYRDSILISLGEYLVTEYPLERTDAIAVLSGSVPDRILEGIDIYKERYAPIIVLTKEEKPAGYDELLSLGIKMPEGHDINRIYPIAPFVIKLRNRKG